MKTILRGRWPFGDVPFCKLSGVDFVRLDREGLIDYAAFSDGSCWIAGYGTVRP